jgi:hypothetical protein
MRRLSPDAVSRSVLLRLSRLPREAAMLASAASVVGSGAPLRHVAALARLSQTDAGAAADALAVAGILEPGHPLRFAHPLLAGVIYDDLPSQRRAAEHRRAAEILHADGADAGLIAAHLLRCDPTGDTWVVTQLRAAAARDLGRGAPEAAVALLRRALDEPPATAIRPELLYELGRTEGLVRDPSAMADLEAALRLSTDVVQKAKVSEDLTALLVIAGAWEPAIALVQGALTELGDDEPDAAARLEAWRAGATAFDPRFVAQFDQRSAHLDELAMRGGAAARPLAMLLAGVAGWRGEPRDTVLRLVERGLDDGRFVEEEEGEIWLAQSVTALVAVDELDRAQGLVEDMLAAASRRGSALGTSAASSFQGWVYAQRGDLARAESEIRGGFELAREHELTFAIPSILRYSIDVLTERPGLSDLAALAQGIELPRRSCAPPSALSCSTPARGYVWPTTRARPRSRISGSAVRPSTRSGCATRFCARGEPRWPSPCARANRMMPGGCWRRSSNTRVRLASPGPRARRSGPRAWSRAASAGPSYCVRRSQRSKGPPAGSNGPAH